MDGLGVHSAQEVHSSERRLELWSVSVSTVLNNASLISSNKTNSAPFVTSLRGDGLGVDDVWLQALQHNPSEGHPKCFGRRRAASSTSNLHHRRLHDYGQMSVQQHRFLIYVSSCNQIIYLLVLIHVFLLLFFLYAIILGIIIVFILCLCCRLDD